MKPIHLPLLALLLTPVAACHLIVDLDDDDNDVPFPIDAPLPDAPVVDASSSNCQDPIPCPTPNGSSLTICGRLWDTELEQPIRAAAPTGEVCTSGATTGPCALSVRYFDALDFAQNPEAAVEMQAAQTYVDDCGRYRAIDLPQPVFGFLAVVTDDASGNQNSQVRTAVTIASGLARPATDFNAYATRVATDQAWTTTAGITGQTFSARGVFVPIFLHGNQPVAGVRVTRDNMQVPGDDFYFSDAGLTRSTVDPARTTTGPNGAALVIDAPTPIQHTGTGGEPAGCQWPQALASSIPGVVLVQRRQAEQPGGAVCP